MKVLKGIALGLFLVTSTVGVSSVAVAAVDEDGRVTYTPKQAIKSVMAKIEDAIEAIDAGTDTSDILKMVKTAKQLNKEINSEKIDNSRQKASARLTSARKALKKGDLAEAKVQLKDAYTRFLGMIGQL